MDELPRDARAFLDLTRDVHDPPDGPAARQRVHARLMAALAAPPALGAPSPAHSAASGVASASRGLIGWVSSTKLALATTVIALTSGGLWALSPQHAPGPRSAVTQPQVADVAPAARTPEETALEPQQPSASASSSRAAPGAEAARRRRSGSPSARSASTPSLSAETVLLARASSQLSRHEVAAALASIEQHRRQFGQNSQLAQEREGLEALAHCVGQRAGARAEAKSFIARAATSVLVTRLELACGL